MGIRKRAKTAGVRSAPRALVSIYGVGPRGEPRVAFGESSGVARADELLVPHVGAVFGTGPFATQCSLDVVLAQSACRRAWLRRGLAGPERKKDNRHQDHAFHNRFSPTQYAKRSGLKGGANNSVVTRALCRCRTATYQLWNSASSKNHAMLGKTRTCRA